MKKLIIAFLILLPSVLLAQEYISVSPKEVHHSDEDGYWDHSYYFVFRPSLLDYHEYRKCELLFIAKDSDGNTLPEDHVVRILTGFNSEYTEAEVYSDYTGIVSAEISTNELSRLVVAVMFNGPDQKIFLKKFKLSYSDPKKY